MADDASTSNDSAVAKVFGIPELLEHILLHLAEVSETESRENNGGVDEEWRSIEPLSCISGVRRVNRIFDRVIVGSQKIQRLIKQPLVRLGEQVDGGDYYSSHCFDLWGGDGNFIGIYTDDADWKTGSKDHPYHILMSGDFEQLRSNQALRRVKINEDGRGLDISFYPELNGKELEDIHDVSMKEGATLGEIFDMGYNRTPEYKKTEQPIDQKIKENPVSLGVESSSIDAEDKTPALDAIEEAVKDS